jgi:hypothetical protein
MPFVQMFTRFFDPKYSRLAPHKYNPTVYPYNNKSKILIKPLKNRETPDTEA